jgi:thiamine-phosphate diphosphorylase
VNLPPLYPITDASRTEPLSEQVRRFGDAGFPLVQFRGKPMDPKAQWLELRKALAGSAANGGWPLIIVNDRADLAVLAAREGLAPWGLHLGQEDLPPAEAVRLPGLGALHFGTSTHAAEEWARLDPACDHAGVGPFRGTASKSDHVEPVGLGGLEAGCAALRAQGVAPVAIGGLRIEDAAACFQAGAESLAMIGEIHRAADPAGLLWRAQTERWRVRPPLRPGQGVALVGSSGAGKSTLGGKLAAQLRLPFVDLDQEIAAVAGRTIPDIFREEGEPAFRSRERDACLGALAQPAVVALGGGAWESESIRQALGLSGFAVFWLAEIPRRCWARAKRDPGRPLAASREVFFARHRARIAAWSALPVVLPLGRSAREVSAALASALD